EHRVVLDELLPEELEGADVLESLRLDRRWDETLAGITEYDQGVIVHRNGPEHARLRVGQCPEVLRGDLEAKDVRDPRVVRAAVEVPAVPGEDEVGGYRGAEIELGDRCRVLLLQSLDLHHSQLVASVDLTHRCRQ